MLVFAETGAEWNSNRQPETYRLNGDDNDDDRGNNRSPFRLGEEDRGD